MKPFRDYSAHAYPSGEPSMGIMVQWYHGHLNGMPFKWPLISRMGGWKVEDFRFYIQDQIEAFNPDLIVFVEDEASADALISEGQFATTIPAMGINPNDLDWSLFTEKQVIIWPDNYCKPSNRILEVIDCIAHAEPASLKIVKQTSMLPENWNANLMAYEAEDGELSLYMLSMAVPWKEYFSAMDEEGLFPIDDCNFLRFPPENHPDHAYA